MINSSIGMTQISGWIIGWEAKIGTLYAASAPLQRANKSRSLTMENYICVDVFCSVTCSRYQTLFDFIWMHLFSIVRSWVFDIGLCSRLTKPIWKCYKLLWFHFFYAEIRRLSGHDASFWEHKRLDHGNGSPHRALNPLPSGGPLGLDMWSVMQVWVKQNSACAFYYICLTCQLKFCPFI